MITRKEFYVAKGKEDNTKACQIVTYYLFGFIPVYRNIIEAIEWKQWCQVTDY